MDRDFRIRSADEAEYIQAVAEYVNVAIDDVRGAKKHVPVQNLILLASMSMADELFKERARIDALKEKIRNQSRLLLSKLEL
jgi:cell division protein ZapA (FtsZ GTPase activity inhibitor)